VAAAMGAAALSFVQLATDRAVSAVGLLERSRCPRCATGLRAREVLPIAGFLLLRGRCRGCGAAIPRRPLAGEVTVGAFWAVAVVLMGAVAWLPVVLVAPLVVMLLHSPLRDAARALLAGLLPLLGVALLTFGLVGLLEGRWAIYGAGGLLGRPLEALPPGSGPWARRRRAWFKAGSGHALRAEPFWCVCSLSRVAPSAHDCDDEPSGSSPSSSAGSNCSERACGDGGCVRIAGGPGVAFGVKGYPDHGSDRFTPARCGSARPASPQDRGPGSHVLPSSG